MASATWDGVGEWLEVVVDVVVPVGAAPPLAAVVVVVGGADALVVADVVVVAVTAGAVAVAVELVVDVVEDWVGIELVVDVVEAMFALPPQPARARAAMMAIAVLFIGPS